MQTHELQTRRPHHHSSPAEQRSHLKTHLHQIVFLVDAFLERILEVELEQIETGIEDHVSNRTLLDVPRETCSRTDERKRNKRSSQIGEHKRKFRGLLMRIHRKQQAGVDIKNKKMYKNTEATNPNVWRNRSQSRESVPTRSSLHVKGNFPNGNSIIFLC
jgi:hypothetical protein